MDLGPEIYLPLLIGGAAILFFILRRMSEIKGPRAPAVGESFPTVRPSTPFQPADRILITHPLIRRAAERALAAGGDKAKYIERDGERIYFNLGRIEDPEQRKNAVALLKGIQEGGGVDMVQVVQLIRRLFNK